LLIALQCAGLLTVNAANEAESAALCGAAKGPGIAVRAILLEKLANAVLDNVNIIGRNTSDILEGESTLTHNAKKLGSARRRRLNLILQFKCAMCV